MSPMSTLYPMNPMNPMTATPHEIRRACPNARSSLPEGSP
jgi:hypothetical protein